MTFGDKLRELRLEKKLTQSELVNALNIKQSVYSRIENNKAYPSAELFDQLCQLYKVTPNCLLIDLDDITIKKYFSHIPVTRENITNRSKPAVIFNRLVLTNSVIILLGISIFSSGFMSIIFTNQAYHYCALVKVRNTIRQGEVIFQNDRGVDYRCQKFTHVDISEYLGQYLKYPHGKSYYYLYKQTNIIVTENKLLMVFGMIFFITGLIVMILESRVRNTFGLTN